MTQRAWTIESTPEAVDALMAELCDAARPILPAARLIEMEIAATEALTNVVLHGNADAGAAIGVQITTTRDSVTVEIRDSGRPVPAGLFETAPDPAEIDPLAEDGRGIALITSLSDRLDYTSTPGSNRLALTFLAGGAP